MVLYEGRYRRNGVFMPIQCLLMSLSGKEAITKLHYHEYAELLYGLSGRAQVSVGGQEAELTAGDMVLVHTGEPHTVDAVGAPAQYIVIKFLPQVLVAGEQTYSEYVYALTLMENDRERQRFFSAGELAHTPLGDLFRHAMQEWNDAAFGYELALRADVTAIFVHILRLWQEKNRARWQEAGGQGERLQKAVAYVAAHYAEAEEEEAARLCGVSRSYFSRTFRRAMGVGFSAYVRMVRMREAERRLLTTEDSVTDIAGALGFSTTSYFIQLFREDHHMTPLAYRAQSRPHAAQEPKVASLPV